LAGYRCVARATNLGRSSSASAEQKLVRAALPTCSVPARCCLSTRTQHSSSRAPRRAATAAQSAMRTQEGVRAEARTTELRAVAQLRPAAARSPAPPCRRATPHPPPQQHPARRRMAAVLHRRRLTEPAAGVRHRAAAPRLREPYPVYARAPGAHAV
jgi:hypothetical protein